jgi:SH3-like domain-containing protein
LKIIQEYDNWRQIRDADGTEGWVNQSLLSGDARRHCRPVDEGQGQGRLRQHAARSAARRSSVVAKLEPGVTVNIGECNGDWCFAENRRRGRLGGAVGNLGCLSG